LLIKRSESLIVIVEHIYEKFGLNLHEVNIPFITRFFIQIDFN